MENEPQHIPLYRQLVEYYRQAILTQQSPPGARIDSITLMMDRFNVSRETAKLVLQKLAAEKLIVKKAGKGSFVADLGPRQQLWGVVVPFFSAQIDSLLGYLHEFASLADKKLEHYIDYNNWREEIRLVGSMIRQRYEAVIVIPTFDETRTAGFYRNLVSGGTVVTLLDHTMTGSYFTYTIQSYDLGVKRAVHYLTGKNPGNLVFIKNSLWAGRNMVQELMEETFKSFVGQETPERQAMVLDNLQTLSREFLLQRHITGILCSDDADAIRVIGRLQQWNFLIPDDISIISYGNTELAQYFTPGITSIDCHCRDMAARTADIIDQHLQGRDTRYCQYVIQPDLVIRET
ncbi:MAG TPA: GntR family transcriptional regulator [bacterium]|nr:GntR family transcriptional regulator [bacterium]HPN45503.1 GntR family transcriptional regulator [bacterium]